MENSESTKQFRVCLFDTSVLIVTPSNNLKAFEGKLVLPHKIKIGWFDHIETDENALNYSECCGILILFGIPVPSFKELYDLLS